MELHGMNTFGITRGRLKEQKYLERQLFIWSTTKIGANIRLEFLTKFVEDIAGASPTLFSSDKMQNLLDF